MVSLPEEIWVSIIKNLEIKDIISISRINKKVLYVCENYPLHIYKELLRNRGITNFENFNTSVFMNFCKIDSRLNLSVSNLLYAYEWGLIDVVKFLLDNLNKKDTHFNKLETNKIVQYIHSYWNLEFKGIGYLLDKVLQEELLIYLLDFNINKSDKVEIPIELYGKKRLYPFKKIYSKIDFQSISTLFLYISVIKNEWEYVKTAVTTYDIIGMGYYEDAY